MLTITSKSFNHPCPRRRHETQRRAVRRHMSIGQGNGVIHIAKLIERKHEQISLDSDHLLVVSRKLFQLGTTRQATGSIRHRDFLHAAGNRGQRRVLA